MPAPGGMTMSLQFRCLALLLIVAAAWLHDQQPNACATSETRVFQRGVALLSVEHRMDVLEKIELSHVATIDVEPTNLELNSLSSFLDRCGETVPRLFRSTDLCYLLMSLQW